MKLVSIYYLKGEYYIHPWSEIKNGPYTKTDPEDIVEDIHDKKSLSATLLKMFDHSIQGIERPENNIKGSNDTSFWSYGGRKSWSVFNKHAKYVEARLENGVIKIIPSKKMGPRGVFQPIHDKVITMKLSEVEDSIVDNLIEAFNRCE